MGCASGKARTPTSEDQHQTPDTRHQKPDTDTRTRNQNTKNTPGRPETEGTRTDADTSGTDADKTRTDGLEFRLGTRVGNLALPGTHSERTAARDASGGVSSSSFKRRMSLSRRRNLFFTPDAVSAPVPEVSARVRVPSVWVSVVPRFPSFRGSVVARTNNRELENSNSSHQSPLDGRRSQTVTLLCGVGDDTT
jgi:hypothetical protein